MNKNITQLFNKLRIIALSLVVVLMVCIHANAQISVTATAGTLGPTAYTTINAAFAAINAGTHRGVINISVTGNTTETVLTPLNRSGLGAANYTAIEIKPAPATTPTISTALGTGAIRLNGVNSLTIDGSNTVGGTTTDLTITNTNVNGLYAIFLATVGQGLTGIRIMNCNIRGVSGLTSTGIFCGSNITATTFTSSGFANMDNTIQNCTMTGWGQSCILTFGSAALLDRNWNITGNRLSNGVFTGMWMMNSQNAVISYNTISNISINGAAATAGIDLARNINGAQVYGNNISNIVNTVPNGSCGIWVEPTGAASSMNIYNNFISNINAVNSNFVGENGSGIYVDYSGTLLNIYHNSINQSVNQPGPATGFPSCVTFSPYGIIGAGTVNLVDNILVNTETVGGPLALECWPSNNIFASINYNDYYCPSGNLSYYDPTGTFNNTLAGLTATFGGNANSIAPFLPSWVSATDLHLQATAANAPLNAGTFITTPLINTDIDGNTRTTPTIGADELILCTLPVVTAPISICPGTTATLSANVTGGTWTSSNTTIATVATGPSPTTVASGVPTATAGGVAIITYATSIGCATTTTVTVLPAPVITGSVSVCAGSTLQLSNSVAGTWTSSNSSVATITPGGGLVSGSTAGSTTIVLTAQATGCTRSVVVTVSPTPSGITGPNNVCPLATIALSSNVAGGTWSSGTSSVATITPGPAGGGIVTGANPGTTLITYTTLAGCSTTTLITVKTPPPPIQGITSVCAGATVVLTDLEVGGGTWTSANTNFATVTFGPSPNGVVTGAGVGSAIITFTSGATSCYTTTLVTVTSSPGAISGITSLCPGATTTLSNSTAGGVWTSNNTTVGTVVAGPSPTTTFTAISGLGTTTVTYSLGGTCTSTIVMTVNASPAPIAGATTVCVGSTIQLSNPVAGGGNWVSSNANATVVFGPSNGTTVTGVSPGTSVITFTTGAGCATTTTITVVDVPGPISGLLTVCTGATITLSNNIAGGTWTSGNTTVATVVAGPSPTTTVIGVAQGTSVITYTNGCSQPTVTITVFAPPAPIVGPLTICAGFTQTLTNTSVGGAWFSNNTPVVTITPGSIGGGVYTGVSAGTAQIRYTTGCGVDQTVTVTVNERPINIYGSNTICLGASTTLSNDGSPLGTWTSSNSSVATIDPATGQVFSSGAVGTTLIVALNLCGGANMTLTVASPTAIGGVTTFCQNSSTQLSNGVAGGTWTSSNTLIAVVDPVTGLVSGVPLGGTGTSNITYTITGGCFTVTTVTTTIAPGPISGVFGICAGSVTCLTNSVGGGVWSSSNISVATISSSGCVTGVGAGTTVISYLVGTCPATATVTVYPLPAPIAGLSSVCVGSAITLSNSTTPGQWTSGNTASATIDPVTGDVTGIAPPGANITYTTAFGCIGTKSITVNALPGPITGNTTICAGSGTTLSSGIGGGGTWTSSVLTVATVSPSTSSPTVFVNSGIAASGTTSVVVTNAAGCRVGTLVTVNPLPSPIVGPSAMCTGTTATLAATPAGGTWISSAPAVANIDPVTGVINANLQGTTVITYSLATTCSSTMTVTVNQMPPAIIGNPQVCLGLTTALTNTLAGGVWSPFAGTNANVNGTGIVTGTNAGTENISYTRAGCSAVVTVTVNPLPLAIIGPTAVCVGSTISLTNLSLGGGTWSSSAPAIAPVGTTTGIVLGAAPGTALVVFTQPTGCIASVSVTVYPLLSTISAPSQMCAGTTAILSTSTPGGTWTSSNTTVATVVAGPGSTTLISAGANPGGVTTVSVTTTAGCTTVHTLTVNPIPAPIMGIPLICLNGTTTLTNVTGGGTWSSSNSTVATVLPTVPTVYGSSVGQTRISYILPSGCFNTVSLTVNPLPTVIGGNPNVCVGSTTQLSNGTPGGSWSSSTSSVATVNNIGTVFGRAVGQTTITYMLGSGCIQTITVTVNPIPDPITGTFAICNGTCTTLSDATPLGGWTSSNTSIATISPSGGTMCGVGSGSARVTFTLSATQCFVTQTITIHPLPATISGPSSVCEGATINISTTTTGGAWSSSNAAVASVTTIGTSVVVTGGTAGVADISYTLGTGCAAVKTITVNLQPGPIVGTPVAICQGSCIQLSNAVAGGAWSSGTSSIATVDAPGQVCAGGTAIGNVNITYAIGTCRSIGIVTVKPQPGAIVGNKTICQGACSILSSTVALGAWSSSDNSIATVNAATGQVCGSTVNTGTVTITYNLNGCSAMTTVTITPQPGPITGPNSVCNTNCITLSNAVSGGAWSSNSTIVSVNPTTGVVCGTGVGNATITYTIGTCTSLKVITVNVQPSAIFGPTQVCNGSSIQLSISSGVGIWTSSNSNVATVNNTGIVTGLDVGTSVITAQIGLCTSSTTITVNPLPSQITGIFFVCQNSQTTLQDLTPGGVWSSSNPAVATVLSTSSGGIYYGATVGTINATYTLLSTGCIATHTLQVIAAPQPIQGPASVCLGGCVQMSDLTNGGTWTSSNPGVASIDPATGVACGTGSSGTVVISYTLGSGCRVVTPLTVYPLTPVTGATTVCEGLTISLSNATVGGAWSSSNAAVATVHPSTGVVTGTGGGTAVIAYTLVSGCAATTTITVSPAPAVITGPNTVCQGQTIALTSATASGVWSSSNVSIADVDPFGIVTGVNAGVAYISYTTGGCPRTFSVTVNAASAPITGNTNICVGNTSDLDDATTGGVWTSSNTGVATVDPVTGMVYAIFPGTTTISYAPSTGCAASVIVTVNSLPSIIVGPTTVCVGSTIALTDSVAGGAWFSSNYSVADVGFANGIVTGMNPGTAVITYQIFNGCTMGHTVTVNALPTISGPSQVCAGSIVTLSGSPAGGTWTSSAGTGSVTVDALGNVTGSATGTANVTYTNGTTGCASVITMSVNPLPTTITGNLRICKGGTSLLASTPSGGVWSSSNTFVGTVNPSTGLVTSDANPPISIFNVIYTLPTGCATQVTMTVVNVPSPISGAGQVCVGSCIPLSDTAAGGAWSSFDPTVATVDPVTGQVCGASAGFTIITYTMGGGSCYQTHVVIVNPLPAPITGNTEVCAALTTQLSDATPGGIWTSANPAIASVTPTGGLVTGGATPGGLTTITYTIPTGCFVTTTFVTHPLPAPITGNTNICVGNTVSLSSAPAPGTWSSANTFIATVPNQNFGVIYGFDYNVPVGAPYGMTTITYTLASTGCIRTTTVAVHPLPAVFTVTGGGSYCSGTGGVHVGLSGSQIGVNYYLYLGSSTPTGPIPGTGGPLDFGLQTVGGVYTVIANNTFTTCSSNMTGSATITVIPSVAPTVTIVPSPNDTVCAGTPVTFVPMSTNQGTSPVYNWSVNGLLMSVGASYTFVPTNGDQVTVVLNSNAICAVPNMARDTVDMTVYISGRPTVAILTAPNDTVCNGTTVTFTAIPSNGGPSPTYWWTVNGSVVGSGNTYTYTPANGDLVQVGMISNSPCRTSDTALSGIENMVLMNPTIPVVTILGGGIIPAGSSDTLTANVTGGIAPITYQWYINGVPVTGATGPNFVIDETNYGDSIGCLIVNGGFCHEQSFGWTYLQVHAVGVASVNGANADLAVIPNPTNGAFWIKGSLGTTHDQDVTVELTDVLGQVVYRGSMVAKNGKLNNRVEVSNTLANGMYMLNVRTESMNKVFHLVVEQ